MSDQPLELPDEARTDANEALAEGTRLLSDQFTITKRIGNGGFGITYLARDNFLDREVVIKECFPEVFCRREGAKVAVRSQANESKFRSVVEMFMREARSIAKMRHPNIIGVHRVFEDNDTAYIALDLIEGQDLLDIVQRGERILTPDQIKEILTKILDAVGLVHEQDLLHRDISPDNILIDKWGNPVLIDFGAAREEASRETRAVSAVLVVKDGYSPQEFYFAGGRQTPSSDLYALGSTFYHVISGEAPPNSQTRMAEVAAGSKDPCVPLVGRIEGYDEAFLAAIDKAMAVLPKDRVQSAAEWLQLIDPDNKPAVPYVASKPVDEELAKALTRLVSETNEHVRNSEPRESKKKAEAPVERRKQLPDWIKEFNAETSEISRKSRDPINRITAPFKEPVDDTPSYIVQKEAPGLRAAVKSKTKLIVASMAAAALIIVSSVVVAHADAAIFSSVAQVFGR